MNRKIVRVLGKRGRITIPYEIRVRNTGYLKEYTEKLPSDREWFFPSANGHYAHGTIYQNFRELLFLSHIHHTGNGPRVHDFRHTFAVHTLEKQLAKGYDPMIIVPRLAAYLGHKSYRETCWYIHLTIASFPELQKSSTRHLRELSQSLEVR